MNQSRRRFLATTASIGFAGLTGCTSGGNQPTETHSATSLPSVSNPATTSATATESIEQLIYVDPTGNDDAAGTQDDPLSRIQAGIDRAEAGDTVHALPGVYHEGLRTIRSGEPGAPITITGPPNAVLRPAEDSVNEGGVGIHHSHIHLTGLTINGLADPSSPETLELYARGLISARPPSWHEEYPDYLTDVKLMPHRVGNARLKLISAFRVNRLEVGEFEVIGPAGVAYTVGNRSGYVLGEVVSIGRSTNNYGTDSYPWPGPDRSHAIHIHHIANLDAHEHTELVKLHLGHYDVTVEYCTDAGGFGRHGGAGASIEVASADTTVRWCEFKNGAANGVRITAPDSITNDAVQEAFDPVPPGQMPGRHNSIYRNRFNGIGGEPIVISGPDDYPVTADRQTVLCENISEVSSSDSFAEECPDNLPVGEGIGHLGGDSPWA